MGRLFGTDGIRGIAGCDLTARLALDVSVAAAYVLGMQGRPNPADPAAVAGRVPWWAGILVLLVSFWKRPLSPDWPVPGWTCCGSA